MPGPTRPPMLVKSPSRAGAPHPALAGDVPLLQIKGLKTHFATGDGETCREPLQVPLPWTRERLVEVVDVEHQPALG